VGQLSLPIVEVRQSFLIAMKEFVAEGRGGPDDDSMVGHEIRDFGPTWDSPAGFAAYVAAICAEGLEETPRPEGRVPSITWWYVDGEQYLGRIALRVRLTEHLLEVGGHIGYDVRPTARRRGVATAMLAGALAHAATLGIEHALLTCDEDNIGSIKTIENAGGKLEDVRQGKRRYWVPTPERLSAAHADH
jgi:predicted acetyltransferase